MAKLILDTSTWIDLAKPRTEEVLTELEYQVDQKMTILLTCDIIVKEWKNNKQRVFQEVIDSLKTHAKSALKMSELLPDDEKRTLTKIIEKYTKIQTDQERLAELFFQRVEKLLKESETYEIFDEMKIEMADRALTKQAPFHNSRNNMADALIYFGAVEHVNLYNIFATDLIFVSSNYKEFSDPTDFLKLHPELQHENVHFHNNLAKALNMRKEMIDLYDEYGEWYIQDYIQTESDILRGK